MSKTAYKQAVDAWQRMTPDEHTAFLEWTKQPENSPKALLAVQTAEPGSLIPKAEAQRQIEEMAFLYDASRDIAISLNCLIDLFNASGGKQSAQTLTTRAELLKRAIDEYRQALKTAPITLTPYDLAELRQILALCKGAYDAAHGYANATDKDKPALKRAIVDALSAISPHTGPVERKSRQDTDEGAFALLIREARHATKGDDEALRYLGEHYPDQTAKYITDGRPHRDDRLTRIRDIVRRYPDDNT